MLCSRHPTAAPRLGAQRNGRRWPRRGALLLTAAAACWSAGCSAAQAARAPAALLAQVSQLSRGGHLEQARAVLLSGLQRPYDDADIPLLHTLAALELTGRDALAAAAVFDDILRLAPHDESALRGRVFALRTLGAPQLAADYALRTPAVFSAQEHLSLRQGAIGRAVKWGTLEGRAGLGVQRLRASEQALAAGRRALAAVASSGLTEGADTLGLEFDLLVALHDTGRYREVISAYQGLHKRHVSLPPYALAAVGAAYLELRDPAAALALYRAALTASRAERDYPERRWQLAEIDCLLDLHDYATATRLADQLLRDIPPILNRGLNGVEIENELYTEALVKAAQARAYAERLRAAETLLAQARSTAPFNFDLRTASADLLQSRDQPRAAQQLYRGVLIDDPSNVSAALGLAETALLRDDLAMAVRHQPALQEHYGENRDVHRVKQMIGAYRRPTLSIEANGGSSPTGGSNRGSSDWSADTLLRSSIMAEHWRGIVHSYESQADFGERIARRERVAIGGQYRGPQWQADAELNQSATGLDHYGGAVRGAWLIDDHWQIELSFASNSNDVPLQAEAVGIRMDSADLVFGYRRDESRELGAQLRFAALTDGNRRVEAESHWQERWISGPRYRLDTRVTLATALGSKGDAVYFNPRQDASFDLQLIHEWTLWRGYQRGLIQRFSVSGGAYWQRGFNLQAMASLVCEQVWQLGDFRELSYGLRYDNHPYDGASDRRIGGSLALTWRF